MEDIQALIQKLDWDTPEAEQAEAIHKLQDIRDGELHLLLQPLGKGYWDGAAEVIVRLGFPRVKPILPGLLEWIQDMNWPGAAQIAPFLREIGNPLIPYIQDVFRNQSQDEEWMYWIFEMILDHWNKEQITPLREDLIRLNEGGTIALKALRTLWVHQIYPGEAVLLLLEDKKQRSLTEIAQLENAYPGIDCEALQREFREGIFTPELSRAYIEQHREEISFCYRKSSLHDFVSEIEELVREVSGSE
ncbi:hypothetical protein C173_25936 [Paenibacillus sp. FSL R7-277]|uniref:DUF5071 domain-containing protein n=1 Tax=Paenibacillus sp. FSL R7-277 TaxID=1227352 RepID=UPI0003E21C77|nr:DUF5071 domain-containing protein [Paenibacillus sp. FSL R7-277]ETT62605.1 hypothetical protein C173_25936 [Paenibacillus sp. FSL R7-277]